MPPFRKNWGLWILALSIVGAYVSVLLKTPGGHYSSFSQPALYLWRGEDPYGVPFAGGMNFYSPSCALFFFSAFAFLPPALGQGLYVGVSIALWIAAVVYFLRAAQASLGLRFQGQPGTQLLWLMVGSELVGAIQATKLEILIVAQVLFAAGCLLRGKHEWLAGVALGVGTQWKFQPLPLVGLLLVVLLPRGRGRAFLAGFTGAIAALTLLPYVFFPVAFVNRLYEHWLGTLREYGESAWMHPIYQHVFQTAARVVGWQASLPVARGISLAAGVGLAASLLVAVRRWKGGAEKKGIVLAVSLASAYAVLFSPLSQSNGYVLYTPLLFGLVFFGSLSTAKGRWGAGAAYFLVSIAYSDLVPRAWYRYFYDHAYKPVGVALLLVLLGVAVNRSFHSSSSARISS